MKLTALSKVMITLALLAAGAGAAYQVTNAISEEGVTPSKGSTASEGGVILADGPSIGSESNPLKVSIVTFSGYAPLLVANGDSLKTEDGSIFEEGGVHVKALLQDDVPPLAALFEGNVAHCAWRTTDALPPEIANLRNAGHDARVILAVDNTRGADGIVTTDPSVKTIEDLSGKDVALLQYTPSHGLLEFALENSALTARQRAAVKPVFINIEEGTAGVRAALQSGAVKSAVLWDPDLTLAVKSGARVIYDTSTASDLIYDVMVCDQRVLSNPKNEAAIQAFVSGWLEGTKVVEANPERGVKALLKTEPAFKLLADQAGEGFIKELFQRLNLMDLSENLRLFGVGVDRSQFATIFKTFDEVYRKAGALANPNSPVVNPSDVLDLRFLKVLATADTGATEKAKQPIHVFETSHVTSSEDAVVTKPVNINFATGEATLNRRAQKMLDEVTDVLDMNGSSYVVVSGHTDSTGSANANKKLSIQRAQVVVDYFVTQWSFDPARFKAEGHGSSKPICDEKDPEALGLTMSECLEANRATRIAIVPR